MGYVNDYIFSHRSIILFSRLGLRKFINYKHGSEGPGCTIENKKNLAIHETWGFPGLATTECGYLPVNQGLK